MKLSKLVNRSLLTLILIVLCRCPGQQPASAGTLAPLQVKLSSLKPPMRFQIEFQNVSDRSLMLVMGFIVNDTEYPDAIHLLLNDSQGRSLHLDLSGPALVGSRIDPMVVPLPAGGTFALPIDLKGFYSQQESMWSLYLPPGRFSLSASYDPTLTFAWTAPTKPLLHPPFAYWQGKLASNQIQFDISTQVGVPPRRGPWSVLN